MNAKEDKSPQVSNKGLRREISRWTKGDQTIQTEGLLGWDDPFMDFDQSMNKAMLESQLLIHGWKYQDTVITVVNSMAVSQQGSGKHTTEVEHD